MGVVRFSLWAAVGADTAGTDGAAASVWRVAMQRRDSWAAAANVAEDDRPSVGAGAGSALFEATAAAASASAVVPAGAGKDGGGVGSTRSRERAVRLRAALRP